MTPADCIGHPTTPLCAVATAAACDVWSDMRLCRVVGYQPVYPLSSQEDYWRLYVFHYKEMAEHVLGRGISPPGQATLAKPAGIKVILPPTSGSRCAGRKTIA
ncbi:hypothetical protein [Defluviicoccus vanus]|uniref:Uncharacterized protein n=1 Tax=Defluviicoccus vanus TaxID=111831 RepID=A0A7H1MZ59_9PROT|nr:hypothetical protein [Defluviicoccus vanus]QNT68745.1 hypothetical protein HQ394_04375 [Defluviicoccus vanus]